MLSAVAFYMFALVIIAAGALIIFSRDLVRSVLFLFVLILNVTGIFLLLDAILVAVCLITIYVAVTVVLFFCVILITFYSTTLFKVYNDIFKVYNCYF